MKKRLTALLVAVMMVVAMIPTIALADDIPETIVDTLCVPQDPGLQEPEGQKPPGQEPTIQITVLTYNGSTLMDISGGTVGCAVSGDKWILTPAANYGFEFNKFEGPVHSGGGQYYVNRNGNNNVTAIFKLKTDLKALTINITGNGSVGANPAGLTLNGKRYYEKNEVVTLTAAPDYGWQFSGFTGTTSGNQVKMDKDKTVTACFAKRDYDVKFYYGAHGKWTSGSANPKTVSVKFGDMPTAPGVKADTGYAFTGWSPELAPADEGQAYTAQYQCVDYKITYDLGGGAADNPELYTIETPTFKLNNPARPGYLFVGWSGTGICGSAMQVTIFKGSFGDRQYKALWKPIAYTVTYNKNTGDGGVTANSAHTYGVMAKLTKNGYYKEGYTFAGWARLPDAAAAEYADEDSVVDLTDVNGATVELFAVWKIKTFEVRFFEQDGVTQIGDTQTVSWNSAAAPETASAVAGHTFDKWVLTGDDDAQPDSLTNVKENIKAVASYTKNSYAVTFLDFEGKVIGTDTVPYGAAAKAPAVPAREGYTFTGWDKDFSSITGALTVTAQYKLNAYIVTFVDHNGTVLSTQTVNHGAAAVAPASPTRSGYTFTGWDKDFSKITGALTVTAQYKKNVTSGDESIPGTSDSGGQPFPWLWIAVAAALAGGIAVIVVTQVRRDKKTGDAV